MTGKENATDQGNAFARNILRLFFEFTVYRFLHLIFTRTWYNADEYYQSMEPAHKFIFGYGVLTWEWNFEVRNSIYMRCISGIYYLLKLFHLDTPWAVIWAPRIAQTVFTAVSDTYFCLWIQNNLSMKHASYAIWVYCSMFFWNYCATRTLINTFETNLTCIGLYYYQWKSSKCGVDFMYWFIVGASICIRPTAATIWLPLSLYAIWRNKISYLIKATLIVLSAVFLSGIIDYNTYGSYVPTWWNFFKFNVLYDIGTWYSTQYSLWYLVPGIPVVIGLWSLVFYYSVFRKLCYNMPNNEMFNLLFVTLFFNIFVYSLMNHKEFRFILPLTPIFAYITSYQLFLFSSQQLKGGYIITAVMISSLLFQVFAGLLYKPAPILVMNDIRRTVTDNSSILFLTPCHSTPLYSHLHVNVTTDILRCDPPLPGIKTEFQRQFETFSDFPIQWLQSKYSGLNICQLPTHIVMFNYTEDKIIKFLKENNYMLIGTYGNHAGFDLEDEGHSMFLYLRDSIDCLQDLTVKF